MWSALDDAAKRAYADIAPMVAVKPRKAKWSGYRPGEVVEVPATAFGEEWAAEHAGEKYTGTLLNRVEEDGAML